VFDDLAGRGLVGVTKPFDGDLAAGGLLLDGVDIAGERLQDARAVVRGVNIKSNVVYGCWLLLQPSAGERVL
jgi:hypothetical protein